MSVLVTSHTPRTNSFSIDSAQIFNQMFSKRKSSNPKATTPVDKNSTDTEKRGHDRRRSMSDIPVFKSAAGRRKSVDGDTNVPKKSFFRRRSKDHVEQTAKSKLAATPEVDKKLTLEELNNKKRPSLKATKPIVCHTASTPINHVTTPVLELSRSPKRVGLTKSYDRVYYDAHGRLSATPPPGSGDEEFLYKCPSSPLLVAVRTAVDSLSQYQDFEIMEKIGSGFYAEVFKVRHLLTNQIMVLKINKRTGSMKMQLKEVELLKKLQHPNILHYVGACVHESQLHPVTEYINGGTLEQLLHNKSMDLSWQLRIQLSLDIARGMEYLHDNGMLHRDLNSRNVLLRKQGSRYTGVVADFGLAATNPRSFTRTMHRSQSVVGTPYWMAPEVLNGKPYNEKADVFSYGIVVCEVISRLDADPDEIPRMKDYTLDGPRFCELPEVSNSSCPKGFLEVAFNCCKLLPVERPSFADINTCLTVIMDDLNDHNDRGSVDGGENIEPQPRNRLSYHEFYSRSRSRSCTPPDLDLTTSRETTV